MKDHFLLMARYNLWANGLIAEEMDSLPKDRMDKEVQSSFPTLRLTMLHIYNAELVWTKRIQGVSLDTWPQNEHQKLGTKDFLEASKGTLRLVESLNEQDINSLCTYHNLSGKEFQTPISGILTHLFNHSTYHRGQLVSMMRILGKEKLPSTDLITYLRSHNS